jgi:hypothetical protein
MNQSESLDKVIDAHTPSLRRKVPSMCNELVGGHNVPLNAETLYISVGN